MNASSAMTSNAVLSGSLVKSTQPQASASEIVGQASTEQARELVAHDPPRLARCLRRALHFGRNAGHEPGRERRVPAGPVSSRDQEGGGKPLLGPEVALVHETNGTGVAHHTRRPRLGQPRPVERAAHYPAQDGARVERVHGDVASALSGRVAVRAQVLAQRDVLRRAQAHGREGAAFEIVRSANARIAAHDERRAARADPGEKSQSARRVPGVVVDDCRRPRAADVDRVSHERLEHARSGAEAASLDPDPEGPLEAARRDRRDDRRVRHVGHESHAHHVRPRRSARGQQGRG